MKVKKKETLLLTGQAICLADCGFNIFELEYSAIRACDSCEYLLSALVFAVFWSMVFYKLVIRHTDRIQNYEDELQFFWHFF